MQNFQVVLGEHIGPFLVSMRKKRGWTQADLARHLGIGQQTISQAERFSGSLTIHRLLKILAILEVDLLLKDRTAPSDTPPPLW